MGTLKITIGSRPSIGFKCIQRRWMHPSYPKYYQTAIRRTLTTMKRRNFENMRQRNMPRNLPTSKKGKKYATKKSDSRTYIHIQHNNGRFYIIYIGAEDTFNTYISAITTTTNYTTINNHLLRREKRP